METAAPLLPWKLRELLDIKNDLFIHNCLIIVCVCVCVGTDIFRCEELSRGNILREGHNLLEVSLTCLDSVTSREAELSPQHRGAQLRHSINSSRFGKHVYIWKIQKK